MARRKQRNVKVMAVTRQECAVKRTKQAANCITDLRTTFFFPNAATTDANRTFSLLYVVFSMKQLPKTVSNGPGFLTRALLIYCSEIVFGCIPYVAFAAVEERIVGRMCL